MSFRIVILTIFLTFVCSEWASANISPNIQTNNLCRQVYIASVAAPQVPAYKKRKDSPLPFVPVLGLTSEQWADQFHRRYEASLEYNFTTNTAKPEVQIEISGQKADGVAITGNEHYPIELVLENLGLVDKISSLSNQAKILSVGEGRSHLVPTLVSRGLKATGVDIWYRIGNFETFKKDQMNDDVKANIEYLEMNKDFLEAADATALPFESGSVDLVLSHQLINNLGSTKAELAMQEMVRVLSKGGEARIAYLDPTGKQQDEMIERLLSIPWLKIEVRRIKTNPPWKNGVSIVSTLLVIQKTMDAP